MKSLRRLAVGQLDGLSRISEIEQNSLVGGIKKDGKSCLYNCMEVIGKECYGSDAESTVYEDGYLHGHGSYSGSRSGGGNISEELYGPYLVREGSVNKNVEDCIRSYFEDAGNFVQGNEARNLFGTDTNPTENTGVMGIVNMGSVAHAVILTGYVNGKYTFTDPSGEMQGSSFDASELISAIDCKQ